MTVVAGEEPVGPSIKVIPSRRAPSEAVTARLEGGAWRASADLDAAGPPPPLVAVGSPLRFRDCPFVEIRVAPWRRTASGSAEVLAGGTLVIEGAAGRFDPLACEDAPAAAAPSSGAGVDALAGPRYRMTVRQRGIYRLTGAYLASKGLAIASLDPRKIAVTHRTNPVPVWVFDGGTWGVMDLADYVEFYGEPLTGESVAGLWQSGDFTDDNVYWLEPTGTVRRGTSRPAAPTSGFPEPPHYRHTERFEVNDQFGGRVAEAGDDHFHWNPYIVAIAGGTGVRDMALAPPSPAATANPITVTTYLHGASVGPHRAAVTLNSVAPVTPPRGEVNWGPGVENNRTDWGFTQADLLLAQPATLRITLNGFPSDADYQIPDWVDVTYDRLFEAPAGELLFSHADADATFRVTELPGNSPRVYEITSGATASEAVRLTGATVGGTGPYEVLFESAASGGSSDRRYLVTSQTLLPWAFAKGFTDNIKSVWNQGELVVIYHKDVVDLSPGSRLSAYLARRAGTLPVRKVEVSAIYDHFSDGIFDPRALRSFLIHAYGNWQAPKPRYVLLLGDSSFDYKRYLDPGLTDPTDAVFVPTMMTDDPDEGQIGYYASDSYFGDVVPGGSTLDYPDLVVSRIPSVSAAETDAYFAKLLAYEDSLLSGPWTKNLVQVADQLMDPSEILFETIQQDALAAIEDPYTATQIFYQRAPYSANAPELCASDIRTAVSDPQVGACILAYLGHGSARQWSTDIVFTNLPIRNGGTQSDIDLLSNAKRYPYSLNFNCMTGGFHIPQLESIMESALAAADRGLLAAYAPTGGTIITLIEPQYDAAFDAMFGRYKVRRSGDVALATWLSLPLAATREIGNHVFLGEPLVRLPMPAPAPPALSGTSGPKQATLTWSGGTGRYHVYRATGSWGGFTRLTATAITQTTYTDTGLSNLVPHHYYVTSETAAGFQGPSSNEVTVVPENPVPPAAPTGLAVANPGTGFSLEARWNVSPEPDLSYYTLRWGTTSGFYPRSLRINAPFTNQVVTGLTTGVRYYFVVTATNDSLRTSPFSAEVSAVPSIPPPWPGWIPDLTIERSGADNLLSWTRPSGNWSGYRVYRATRMSFTLPSVPANPDEAVFDVAGPDTTTFLDAPGSSLDLYYVVVARP